MGPALPARRPSDLAIRLGSMLPRPLRPVFRWRGTSTSSAATRSLPIIRPTLSTESETAAECLKLRIAPSIHWSPLAVPPTLPHIVYRQLGEVRRLPVVHSGFRRGALRLRLVHTGRSPLSLVLAPSSYAVPPFKRSLLRAMGSQRLYPSGDRPPAA